MKSFDRDKFHVVTMVSNPVRFASRYRLYRQFEHRMKAAGVNLWTVELQLRHRPFVVTNETNPFHIQLRYNDEVWHKENALNLGIQCLPDDWESVAWVDADVEFMRIGHQKDWVEETIHALQVYDVVQLFETAIDLGPFGGAMHLHNSFMSQYIKSGARFPETPGKGYPEWHPGFAWAARRSAIDAMGGLFDRAILGAGDRHMALALVGKGQYSFHPATTGQYKESIMNFQARCESSIRRNVGYLSGTLLHHWHGKKADRRYWDRWQILVRNQYNPYTDVKANSYGVLQLHDDGSDRFMRLRDEIRAYNRGRNEDSIDEK